VDSGFGNACALRAWFGAAGIRALPAGGGVVDSNRETIDVIKRSDDGNGGGIELECRGGGGVTPAR